MNANQKVLIGYMEEHKLTQAAMAERLAAVTHRPCSIRTIKSWVADSAVPSSRPCPDWVKEAVGLMIQMKSKER